METLYLVLIICGIALFLVLLFAVIARIAYTYYYYYYHPAPPVAYCTEPVIHGGVHFIPSTAIYYDTGYYHGDWGGHHHYDCEGSDWGKSVDSGFTDDYDITGDSGNAY